jgi:hypothetical protein
LSRVLKTRIITALVLIPLTLAALFGLPPRLGRSDARCRRGRGRRMGELAALESAAGCFSSAPRFSPVRAAARSRRGLHVRARLAGSMVSWICGAATVFWLLVAPAWLVSGGA